MILHCGYADNMKVRQANVSDELFCAMRVHLMNETEVHTFCPATARIWNDNCTGTYTILDSLLLRRSR